LSRVEGLRQFLPLIPALLLFYILRGHPSWMSAASVSSELAIFFLLVRRRLRGRGNGAESWLIVGYAAVCYADIIYHLDYRNPAHEQLLSFWSTESCYTVFMLCLLGALWSRYSSLLRGKATAFIAAGTAAFYGGLSWVYVLMPFYSRSPAPHPFLVVNSTVYAVLSVLVVSSLIPIIVRINDPRHHLFCQTVLFVNIVDFTLRYGIAFPQVSGSMWLGHGWELGMVLVFSLLVRDDGALFDGEVPSTGYFSLRAIYAIAVFAAFLTFVSAMHLSNIYRIGDAFQLANVLALAFCIWLIANIIGVEVSRSVMSVNALPVLRDGRVDGGLHPQFGFQRIPRLSKLYEFDRIVGSYNALIGESNALLRRYIEREKLAQIGEFAAQVAHDIRSPLAALDAVLKDVSHLPEEKRIMIRSAAGRIRDIANHLVETHRARGVSAKADGEQDTEVARTVSVELLSCHLDAILSEKRLQFRSRSGVQIEARYAADAYGLFAEIPPAEFKRVLSNLINNSVEALGGEGSVAVSLDLRDGDVLIEVVDSGEGITPEVLSRLGQRGGTYGKAEGSGLGLFHAKTCMASWGGTLAIASQVGKGTTVTLRLPRVPAPDWFVPRLELAPRASVIVLDDDPSIHQIWNGRFASARVKEHAIDVLHFSMPDELRRWAERHPDVAKSALYLSDYEFRGSRETGLDFVKEFSLGDRAILVTSRFEEKNILEVCLRLKVRMIPKGLAAFVPISVAMPPQAPDAVLLDNDALVHMTWKIAAESEGIRLSAFRSPEEFLSACDSFPKDTPIYIDSELDEGRKGEDVAKGLNARGFTRLFLATGYDPETLPPMPWITRVVGKDPPWVDAGG